ncbi:hypothetical protein [Flavobacterium sp.]|uniref:hypothetical protein n=1 Tax=Flavobacterium sp. TaxID=239 RepID=UPI002B4AE559|nr:hypothetical protein [Flavobacterium sp.]HLP63136.1 hypothetical protein [Flavobacterium sp.]
MEVQIKIPLFNPIHAHDDILTHVDECNLELLELNEKLEFSIEYVGILTPKIFFEDSKSPNKLVSKNLLFSVGFDDASISFDENLKVNDNDQKLIIESIISDDFRLKVYYFLILTQIAKPGTIKSREGTVICNNRLQHYFPALVSIQQESYEEIYNIKWPKLKTLKFIEVWEWFNRHQLSFERHSNLKIERALNAYTYLFRDNIGDIVFDLLWSLVGIEVIYCSSKEGIAQQIFEKTQVVLGPLVDFKQRLKDMYNLRSRLLHGDLDIPPNHYPYDDDHEIKYQQELFNSVALSTAVLTATFQEMVIADKVELKFKYELQ